MTKVAPKQGKINSAQKKVLKTEGHGDRPSSKRGSLVGNETSADMSGALGGRPMDKINKLGSRR